MCAMAAGTGSTQGPPARPGSQGALRGRNIQRVVSTLLTSGPSTQADLARLTGLSGATVSSIVRGLVDAKIATVSPTTSSGRRAVLVRLVGRGAVAVGIDIGRRHVRVMLVGLDHEVIAERLVALPQGHEATETIDTAARLLEDVLAAEGLAPDAILGVGAGIPGPIDSRTGTVVDGAILPEWVGLDLRSALEERIGLPVHVDNDANLGALAQVTWSPGPAPRTMVFLKIGTGIGCGLIIGGEVFYGHVGVAGEIGHTPLTADGPSCRCGNNGCLELYASTSAMIRRLTPEGERPIGTSAIVRNALAGDVPTLRVLDDAGSAVGRVLAGVANLINPEAIVLGGPLAELGELLLDPVRRALVRFATPLVATTTTVTMSAFGERAEALGAAALVLRQPDLPQALQLE